MHCVRVRSAAFHRPWGDRSRYYNERSDRDFCRFLTIALGSNAEVEAQVTIAGDIGCIDSTTVAKLLDQTDHIGRMIRRLIQHMAPSG